MNPFLRVCVCGLLCAAGYGQETVVAPGVGQAVAVTVVLPSPDIEAAPARVSDVLHVMIDRISANDQQWRYDLRVIGFEPGTHALGPWLRHSNGQPLSEALAYIQVPSLLGPDENWDLGPITATPSSQRGLPYGRLMIGLGVLWLGLGMLYWWWRRPRKPRPLAVVEDPLPDLVRRAVAGLLDSAELAQMEHRLLERWRHRRPADDPNLAAAIARLRSDGEFGELLQRVEDHLHRPLAQRPELPKAEQLLPPESR